MALAKSPRLSRRDFLKLISAGAGALAFRPFYQEEELGSASLSGKVVRVATTSISVYSEPSDESQILFQKYRDDLLNVYYEVISEDGPGYNPLWYRVWGGYVHSAYLQVVETHLNEVDYSVLYAELPGKLGEITVPFTQSYLIENGNNWRSMLRFYYGAVFWIVGVITGYDGRPWYRIKDECFQVDRLDFYVPAEHVRLIPESELTPISSNLAWADKRIEVSIAKQELVAYEKNIPVMSSRVSTGVPRDLPPGEIPTYTPTGDYNIQSKMPSRHMGEGQLTDDPEAYELPGIPWVCYFEPVTGVATHGTYWHTNFGMTMSHGCVNLPNDKAKWIFRWSTPYVTTLEAETRGYGTRVIVS